MNFGCSYMTLCLLHKKIGNPLAVEVNYVQKLLIY